MLWLAGLMGMMVLAGLALVATREGAGPVLPEALRSGAEFAGSDAPHMRPAPAERAIRDADRPGRARLFDLLGRAEDDLAGDGEWLDGPRALSGAETLPVNAGRAALLAAWEDDRLAGAEGFAAAVYRPDDEVPVLAAGARDIAAAGTEDVVVDACGGGAVAELHDFDPAEDRMVVVYDDSSGHMPELELRPNAGSPDMTDLLVDGELVAVLPTADLPEPGEIVFMGHGVAHAVTAAGAA